jgi:hypothetical protein
MALGSLLGTYSRAGCVVMTSFLTKLLVTLGLPGKSADVAVSPLDYEKWVHLDAEDLAEQGMAAAYEKLLPQLSQYVAVPTQLEEVIDSDMPRYAIRCKGVEYLIYDPSVPVAAAWPRATYYFFLIVNEQLAAGDVRFYAINAGNDLGGLFLTTERAQAARLALARKSDWPYIPTLEPPFYGLRH